MLIWIWTAAAVLATILWFRWRYAYFKRKGVKHPAIVPLFGNLYEQMTRKKHFIYALEDMYNKFPDERFVYFVNTDITGRYIGTFEFVNPVIMLRDPELLRQICIKDFDYFVNHRTFGSDNDIFITKSLFGLKDDKWRDMRATLSPAFTGSKLRNMIPLMLDCNESLVKHLKLEIEKAGNLVDIDTHDLLTRYTNDVIATCVFGLQSDSFANKNNVIYELALKLTNFKFIQIFKLFLSAAIPNIGKVIELEIFPSDAINFFKLVVQDTMKNREEHNVVRPDMIQILLEVKKGTLKHEHINDEKDAGFATVEESAIGKSAIKKGWTDDDLTAQAFLFYIAGFDAVATCMKFLLLELAINPDIQDRLRKDIEHHHEKSQGRVDYEKINEIKYLDMVLSETLRKWPPAVNVDRSCTKQYNMGKPNNKAEKDFILEKGMTINIPIYPIHRNPEFYPNPEKFDPERFSDENKHNINQFAFIPFGVGPRNCIGSRFALSEVKAMTYELIRHFELSPSPQTMLPPRFDMKIFNPRLEGGHWLRFKNIKNNTSDKF